MNRDRAYDCIDAMRPIAQAHGVSVAQVALAWLLHQPQVTSVIIGAKRPEQLTENLAATQVALSDSELAAVDEVSRLPADTRAGCSNARANTDASSCLKRGDDLMSWLGTGSKRITLGPPGSPKRDRRSERIPKRR